MRIERAYLGWRKNPNKPTKEILQKLYWEEGLSQPEIALKFGASQAGVFQWMKEYSIPARQKSEAMHHWIKRTGRDIAENNSNWKGGRCQTKRGYILIRQKDHPRASRGYVKEHILVWEKAHNKPLPKGWIIHHVNGIASDNRPENLVAMAAKRHDVYIPILKKRIRELEIRNSQLEHALREGQFMFRIGGEN